MQQSLSTIQLISIWVLPIIFAITVHEVAHGYVAGLLGDKTAKLLGRLTLNPLKHIDLFGTIIIPLALLMMKSGFVIGWAKPVPINSRHLRKPKRDLALIAAAGPSANFLMAIIWAAIAKLGLIFLSFNLPGAEAIRQMGYAGIGINLMLMVLNLLPIPPLDGGHIVAGLLPRQLAMRYERLGFFGFIIILVLLALGLISIIMLPVVNFLYNLLAFVFAI